MLARLLLYTLERVDFLLREKIGGRKAAGIAMIAIMTSDSINVNP